MKIVTDDNTFVIPFENSNRIILISGEYKEELISCLSTYFGSKKKSKCLIYDNDVLIDFNDINFVYIPDDLILDSNFEFKPKSILNNSVSEIMRNNPDYFLSLERIRSELLELETDKGVFKLEEIMSNGISKRVKIEMKEFNYNLLLQFLCVTGNELTLSEKQIVLMNVILYENRRKTNVIYIDR